MGPLLVFLLIGLIYPQGQVEGVKNAAEAVASDLLQEYVNDIRPYTDGAVIVKVGLTITQILDVNENSKAIKVDGRLLMNWHDSRLAWNSKQYNGTTSLRLPAHKVWLPDITLYNSGSNMVLQKLRLVIYANGMVSYIPKLTIDSPCELDKAGILMVCSFKMGSWAYDGYSLDIRDYFGKGIISLEDFVQNSDWEIVNSTIRRNEKYYKCCSEPYPDLTFTLTIKRKERCLDCLVDVDVVPIILVAFLVPIQFLIPVGSRERATFSGLLFVGGVLIHLSLGQSLAIAQRVWQTDIQIYYNSTLALIVVSVIISVFNIQLCSNDRKRYPLPALVKKVFLSGFNYLVLVKSPWTSEIPDTMDVKVIPTDEQPHEEAGVLERQVAHLIRLVQSLVSAANGRLRDRDIGAREEWRALSLVIDRLCAVVFFIIFILYTADLMG